MCQSIVPAVAVPQGQSSPCRAAGQPKKNAPLSVFRNLEPQTFNPTPYTLLPQPPTLNLKRLSQNPEP